MRPPEACPFTVEQVSDDDFLPEGRPSRRHRHEPERSPGAGEPLRVLLMHLLKWRYQPAGRQTGHSWADSYPGSPHAGCHGAETHPGMHQHVPAILVRAWRKARREASHQAGLSLAIFPQACPWTLERLLDRDFWPEEASPASC